jgi:hypothetical protein
VAAINEDLGGRGANSIFHNLEGGGQYCHKKNSKEKIQKAFSIII